MKRFALVAALIAPLLFQAACESAQVDSDRAKIEEILDRDGKVELAQARVVIEKYDYKSAGDPVEAILFRSHGPGRNPGLLLIPGYNRTARDYLQTGIRFAKEGFACVAITQRGFGGSKGEPDFVGPKTMASLEAGFRRLRAEAHVDSARMGVFGYSRGAMAASLLAVRLAPSELQAAVFAAGVYDFKRAHDEIEIPEIRANMEREAGLSREAVEQRSSILRMESLPCPVLILHGEQDRNAPVSQAHLLRDRLTELKKPFEYKTLPAEHNMGRVNVENLALAFFERHLAVQAGSSGQP